MAPEQASAEEVDARCDLFSLGAVLYRASTGELPFGGKDSLTILKALATRTPVPPHKIAPSLPQAFSDLVMHLLAKDRSERPQSAAEVMAAIRALTHQETAKSTPTLPPPASPSAVSRKKGKAASPPRPNGDVPRQKVTAGPGVRTRVQKKARRHVSPKRKRPEPRRDGGRVVLAVALVLLGVALLVFLLGLLRYVGGTRTAGSTDPRTKAAVLTSKGCTRRLS
jgi:serine/threonine-protein kinase